MPEPYVVVQARTGSGRFPRKVLADLHGAPMIVRQLERLGHAGAAVALATSTERDDDELAAVVEQSGVPCIRGPLEDVLGRYVQAARTLDADPVVRVTGDCPLIDAGLVDEALAEYGRACEHGVVYVSNTQPPTFPDGLDVEVVARAALERAGTEARDADEREHVTLHLVRNAGRYPRSGFRAPSDLSRLRWTVDHPQDLDFVRAVYEALYPLHGARFTYAHVLELLEERPEIAALQGPFARNEALTDPL